jgi:hypothetical protein
MHRKWVQAALVAFLLAGCTTTAVSTTAKVVCPLSYDRVSCYNVATNVPINGPTTVVVEGKVVPVVGHLPRQGAWRMDIAWNDYMIYRESPPVSRPTMVAVYDPVLSATTTMPGQISELAVPCDGH